MVVLTRFAAGSRLHSTAHCPRSGSRRPCSVPSGDRLRGAVPALLVRVEAYAYAEDGFSDRLAD